MSTPIPTTGRDRENVYTGAPDVSLSGGFWVGPAATDAADFPTSAFEDTTTVTTRLLLESAGYITSDGVSKAESRSTEKILDWNLDVIDIVETDYGLQLSVTFAEAANAAVLKYLYGEDNVTVSAQGVYIREGARVMDNHAIMFDIKGKGDAKGRGFAAETQVASVGDISYVKTGLITYSVTIDVLNDVTGAYMHTWYETEAAEPVTP
jgi:hypothetical protein